MLITPTIYCLLGKEFVSPFSPETKNTECHTKDTCHDLSQLNTFIALQIIEIKFVWKFNVSYQHPLSKQQIWASLSFVRLQCAQNGLSCSKMKAEERI